MIKCLLLFERDTGGPAQPSVIIELPGAPRAGECVCLTADGGNDWHVRHVAWAPHDEEAKVWLFLRRDWLV